MLGKLNLGNFNNGNLTLGKCTQVYLPGTNLTKNFIPCKFSLRFFFCCDRKIIAIFLKGRLML